jgi:hypothetical protein
VKGDARAGPRALPRRRKPSLAAKVRPFWIVGLIVAALLAWGGTWLAQSPWFRVTRVGIDLPLGSPVSREQVRQAAAISADANLWLLNPRAIAQRIEAIPYIERASIHRGQFPAPFVELAITVRRASACVAAGGREVTIDATRRVLQLGCAAPVLAHVDAGAGRLPAPGASIADPDVAKLLGDAKTLADANLLVRTVRRDRWGGVEAVASDGVILRFGDDADLAKKAALIQPVRGGIGTKRGIRAIDVRAPGTPIVEFR